MLDRAIIGIVLVALLFGLTCFCMGAIKLRGLEQRVDLLNKQVKEVQKQTRIARQDVAISEYLFSAQFISTEKYLEVVDRLEKIGITKSQRNYFVEKINKRK